MMDVLLLHDIHHDEPRINNLEVTRLCPFIRSAKITNFLQNIHIHIIQDVHEIE